MKSREEPFRIGSNAVEDSDEKMARLQVAVPVFYQRAIQRQVALLTFKQQSRERVGLKIVCSLLPLSAGLFERVTTLAQGGLGSSEWL